MNPPASEIVPVPSRAEKYSYIHSLHNHNYYDILPGFQYISPEVLWNRGVRNGGKGSRPEGSRGPAGGLAVTVTISAAHGSPRPVVSRAQGAAEGHATV